MGDDMARESVMMERSEMIKIQVESQAAADDTDARPRVAEEEAQYMKPESRIFFQVLQTNPKGLS